MLNETITALAFGFLIFAILLLVVWLWRIERRMRSFFAGKKAGDLEDILAEFSAEMVDMKKALGSSDAHLGSLERRLQKSIQKLSVTRFNPFKDAGGDQSFVIALLDESHDGVVLSSLYSRDGVRVYAKPVEAGKSAYPMSREEMETVEKAAAIKTYS